MANYLAQSEEQINYYKNERQYENLIIKRNFSTHTTFLNKEEAILITRQIPLKLLALDWLNKISPSIETRAYLIENFLPILVLGCEKLLKEAQNRNLIEHNKKDINFNPINYLAQYLMRNNPKYNNQNENSHYVRSMREVYQELREQMFEIQGNRLAKLKEDVRKQRAERDKQEKLKSIESNRRKNEFDRLFDRFHLSEYGRLEIAIIKNALSLYKDHVKYLTDENFRKQSTLNYNSYPSFCYLRDELNLSKRILRHEFNEVMQFLTEGLSSDVFDYFVEYFEQCSIYFVKLANSTNLNRILKYVFKLIDSTNTGFLSRRRLIKLFEEFKEKRKMCEFRNPLEWPVLDCYIKFENKLDERKIDLEDLELNEKMKINEYNMKTNLLVNPVEEISNVINHEQNKEEKSLTQNEETVINEPSASSMPEQPLVEESKKDETLNSEAQEAVNSLQEQSQQLDATLDNIDPSIIEPVSALDVTKPIPAKAELVTTKSNNNTLNISENNIKTSLKKEDPKMIPIRPIIKKDDELLFIKNGILYYIPLKEPLNAFDSSFFVEKKNKSNQKNKVESVEPIQYDFDTEFVNERQFLNIIHNYMMSEFLNSEIYVNDLITFIKDNFAENQYEKLLKIKKAENIKKEQIKLERYSICFDKLDINSSGLLSLNFINNLLTSFKDGLYRERIENAIKHIREEILEKSGKQDDFITKDEFNDFLSSLIEQIESTKVQDQIINYLNSQPQVGKTRNEERKSWLEQIRYIGEITYGTFEPLYNQLFLTLLKDAENYGNGKTLSAYVGILERLEGKTIGLRYHAATPHDSKLVLGKTLNRKVKNVSFGVIDKSTYEHIPKVRANSSVHFFDQDGRKNGSLIVFPLKYTRNKIFGTFSVDTLNDFNESTFQDHEINFYQGVANTFAKSYANIIFKNRLIKTCITAIEWLHRRCTGIESCNVYIVQVIKNEVNDNPQITIESNTQLQSSSSSSIDQHQKQHFLEAKSSLSLKPVLKYAFKSNGKLEETIKNDAKLMDEELPDTYGSKAYECARTSETTLDIFNQQINFYVPLRNETHKTIFVMEIKSKEYTDNLQKFDSELEQIETILYVLHKCQEELLDEHFASLTRKQYSFEHQYEHEKFEILFEKAYLNHINNRLKTLLGQKVIELMPDGSQSPETSQMSQLIRLVSDLVEHETFNDEKIIDENLLDLIQNFDPTNENFKFKSSTSKLNIQKEDYFNDLNKYYLSLAKSNTSLKLLTDWSYLIKQLKMKTDKILTTNNINNNASLSTTSKKN